MLAASGWLADPRVGYLAVCVVATALAALTLRATPSYMRGPLALACVALVALCGLAARTQQRLALFSAAPAEVGAAQATAQRALLRSRVDEELVTLADQAARARRLSGSPEQLVGRLERIIGAPAWRSVLILDADTLVSWAGTLHANPRVLTGPTGVASTPFGLTLYATSDSGGVRGVATSLLYAAPPADRLTRGLSQRLPGNELTEGFVFAPPGDSAGADALRYSSGGQPLFVARALVHSAEEVLVRLRERARVRVGVALLVALIALVVACARREAGIASTLGAVLVVLSALAIVPLSAFSTRSRLFDASVYFYPAGRAFTANAAALTITSATLLLTVLLLVRRSRLQLPRRAGIAIAVVGAVLGPYFVRSLSRGIAPPADGANSGLWLIWVIPLCLAATTLLVVAAWGGRIALAGQRGVHPVVGPALALLAALVAPTVWMVPGQWPQWYVILWALAIGAFVVARPGRRWLISAATIAALGAATVVWGSTSRGRVELAERDVMGLDAPDAYATTLANRLAMELQGSSLPRTPQALMEQYVRSDLAAAGYPVVLASWRDTTLVASFGSAPVTVAWDTVSAAAVAAQRSGPVEGNFRTGAYGVRVVAVPMREGAMTILVAPRTKLIGNDAYARWYGLAPGERNEPPYTVQITNATHAQTSARWRREGTTLHGDWPIRGPDGPAHADVRVDLRGLDSLLPRGGLLLLVNLLVVGLIWLLSATADGRLGRWLRLRRRGVASYRTRLSFALFLFFLVPAGVFAVWSWQQLFADAQQSRHLLVTETMRAVSPDRSQPGWLRREGERLDTKLLLYDHGVVVDASDSLFAELTPLGALLRPSVSLALGAIDGGSATRSEALATATGMMGYRSVAGSRGTLVIAAPARVDDVELDRRRRDLGVLVLFATAVGAAAALWLSALAARQLARPIGALRRAARAVARGERELPFGGEATSEFVPVFRAFRAMAEDLGASRAALEEAQRRTDAVLRTVASGVIAVDERGQVILANPRADTLLGDVPLPGEPVSGMSSTAVAARLARFLQTEAPADGFEMEREGRALRGQLSRLSSGGVVLTLDDVTELAHAQRVLAWGEMARQVAHEIKNPLTPIRLGVQHLRRARGRPDFDTILDQNVSRILTEIDRLDEIARSFSRYGSAPSERAPAEPTDVAAIVQDVVALETLGEGGVQWSCSVDGELPLALARDDELREVLLNLFENARLASARVVSAKACVVEEERGVKAVQIAISDDGSGIAENVLPQIFEPHFSTRTSGSGLGLAITRRMVESWGGTVAIESALGVGTTVRVRLRAVM